MQARLAYIKSTAVMSMMGYIMGLGDRHGENILFDTTTGQTYHVDFNCIFNKGESLTIPETVPFRLTQNMVDALGPLGVEGLFRKCCEVVLRVLQKESSILLSYLQPFIYDTLVSRSVESGRSSATTAQKNIWQLEARLNRLVKYKKDQCNQSDTQPISLEGQVTYVIDEARSLDNLSKMFFGWGAWM